MKTGPDPAFWELIRPYTGAVRTIRNAERGYRSDVTAVVEGESGSVFVKAVSNPKGGRLEREVAINAYVSPPELLWTVRDDRWIILGFEVVEGPYADFEPGSADLPAVVESIDAIGRIKVPELARDWIETRWDSFCDATDAALFRGNSLLHGDINPDNFLMSASGRAILVDWSWPTVGAGFIDPACLVVQLIATGHSAEDAEGWAGRCEVWGNSDPKGIDAFAAATVRMWRGRADRNPGEEWLRAMTTAAEAWASHRGVSA